MSGKQPFVWKTNERARAIQKVSERHDLAVDNFVENKLKPSVRIQSTSVALQITTIRTDDPLSGTCEYIIGPLPLSSQMSDVVVERIVGAHCNQCHTTAHPCNGRVSLCTLGGRPNVRCLVINKKLPVPLTRRELVEIALILLVVCVIIFMLYSAGKGLHGIWHGYHVPWVGWRL